MARLEHKYFLFGDTLKRIRKKVDDNMLLEDVYNKHYSILCEAKCVGSHLEGLHEEHYHSYAEALSALRPSKQKPIIRNKTLSR